MSKKLLSALLLSCVLLLSLSAQEDSRYDSGFNLPFNQNEGEVNPQTGNITLSFTDLSLPGRGGLDFVFGRIYSLNQSNIFHMYRDPVDGANRLTTAPVEKHNRLGAGWNSTLPFMDKDSSSGTMVLNLFFRGKVYEVDQTGVKVRNPARSNLLGYDLLDKRIYEDRSIGYGELGDLSDLRSRYPVADTEGDRSAYQLILDDHSRYWFRPDGQLMVQKDPAGLNMICYFYDAGGRLVLVIDTIGREIRFSYDPRGNLAELSWGVTRGVRRSEGNNVVIRREQETRRIIYSYESALSLAEVTELRDDVVDFQEPYLLTSITNPEGIVFSYTYEAGPAFFSYNSTLSHSKNTYLLLKEIKEASNGEYFKNRRVFEYALPEKGMFTRWFYSGYMEYYRISREYYENRFKEIRNDKHYQYREKGDNGNFNQYSTIVTLGNIKNIYTYSVNDNPSANHVLDSLLTETADGFVQLTDYVYDEDRTKIMEEVFRKGHFVYGEYFKYNKKGQLLRHEDKGGLITLREYDDIYGVPLRNIRKVIVDNKEKEYETEIVLNDLGLVVKKILYRKIEGKTAPLILAALEYDEYGNQVTLTDPEGNCIHTVYDEQYHAFPVKRWQDVTVDTWSSGGDAHSNWLTDPDAAGINCARSWKAYNSDGTLWLEIDNTGYAIEHYYDALGAEISRWEPDIDDYTGFAGGNDFNDITRLPSFALFLSSRANNPGQVNEINYGEESLFITRDIDKSKGTVKITGIIKDGLGKTVEEIDYGADLQPRGIKKMTYDSLGRMISLTDPDAGENFKTVKVSGTTVSRHDKTWVIGYDDLGRQKFILYPGTAGSRTDMKRLTYNDLENSVITIDPEGRKVYEHLDWKGNLLELINYGGVDSSREEKQVYTYTYDLLGRKTSFKDPEGNLIRYTYDERDMLIRQDYGASGQELLTYDDLGRLVLKVDRKGQYHHFVYDQLGRNRRSYYYPAKEDFEHNRPSYYEEKVFDSRGNTVRVSNPYLIEHFTYNPANGLKKVDRRLKGENFRNRIASVWGGDDISQIFTYRYTYNDLGGITSMAYPDGGVHFFNYEPYSARLSSISGTDHNGLPENYITRMVYNKSGQLISMEGDNGTVQYWEFDNRKRISSLRLEREDSVLSTLNYTLNSTGDIIKINDHTYTYDSFSRITGANTRTPGTVDSLELVRFHFGSFNDGLIASPVIYNPEADLNGDNRINGEDHHLALNQDREALYDRESFTYDKNGNRLRLVQNGVTFTYSYGPENRLESIYKKEKNATASTLLASYEHDANGNTTKRVVLTPEGKEITEYSYDILNRLTSVSRGDKKSFYYYDSAGNRFMKEDDRSLTLYLRHGRVSVAMDVKVNNDTSINRGEINRYILSGDLIAGQVTREILSSGTEEASRFWYHLDHLNSTKWVTDETGDVALFYEYRAFGDQLKRLDGGGNTTKQEVRYTYSGKELDESGFYYFNARYYDGTLGRFITLDPVRDGTNWYVYCNNNPLRRIDPTGLGDYVIGQPQEPSLTFDNDFAYNPNAKATFSDYTSWAKWGAMLSGAVILRPDLIDGCVAYAHYRDGSGTDHTVDYAKAYNEDKTIQAAVDTEIASAREGAERLYASSGQNSFSITGTAEGIRNGTSENWQKAIGAHHIWGSADVTVDENGVFTMTITIHAIDKYNFNKGMADIASGAKDDENGHFEVLGWAKSFMTRGTMTRVITWTPAADNGGTNKEEETP